MNEIFKKISKPTLLLDSARVNRNINRMVTKANKSHVRLRPHFKTHQSAEIGEWFRSAGVSEITVSSVDMARYFAGYGWRDITLAVPVNLRQVEDINSLANDVRLNIVLESSQVAEIIAKKVQKQLDVWLKVDVGYHRTGIAWDDLDQILSIARIVHKADILVFKGILTHAGHTYGAGSKERIIEIYRETLNRLQTVRFALQNHGFDAAISVGDTPGCSLVEEFGLVDEVRPGNFVFYDLSQLQFGACKEEDIAVAVACPVIAKHPERKQIVIYGGAIHLSKESLTDIAENQIFGKICLPTEGGWSVMYQNSAVVSVSQEHGIIQAEDSLFYSVEVGDLVIILPVHSCLTANLLGGYVTLSGRRVEMFRY